MGKQDAFFEFLEIKTNNCTIYLAVVFSGTQKYETPTNCAEKKGRKIWNKFLVGWAFPQKLIICLFIHFCISKKDFKNIFQTCALFCIPQKVAAKRKNKRIIEIYSGSFSSLPVFQHCKFYQRAEVWGISWKHLSWHRLMKT